MGQSSGKKARYSGRLAGRVLPWGHRRYPGRLQRLPSAGDPMPEEIGRVARAVRSVLLADFPDRPTLFKQCKRASVMLEQMLGKRGIHVSLRAGQISAHKGTARGNGDHIWCRLKHPESGQVYLLDVTLTQFSDLFDFPVPQIVWGEYRQTARRYGYLEDGQNNWLYDPRDFDPARVEAVEKLLKGDSPTRGRALC